MPPSLTPSGDNYSDTGSKKEFLLKYQMADLARPGENGRMKSMHMFMEKHQVQQGIKISQMPYDSSNRIISLPFYSLEGFMRK